VDVAIRAAPILIDGRLGADLQQVCVERLGSDPATDLGCPGLHGKELEWEVAVELARCFVAKGTFTGRS
jgi:hypothetical protein